MKQRIYPEKDYCIGCKLCEVACITAHSMSKDVIIAMREERANGLASCKEVFERGASCVALSCRHCENPMCVAACIAGALTKDPVSGYTSYSEEKCVSCWSCLMACPFGAISRNEKTNKIIKCDLCQQRGSPACVDACPNKALLFEDRS